MERPAELDFALDIDDLAAAEADLSGDAARSAKRECAEADDRETVDLADLLAIGLDADRLAADFFLHAPVDAVAATYLRIDRRLHLRLADDLFAGISGKLVGFLQQIDKGPHTGRQFVGVAREPGSLLDHPGDGITIEGPELFPPADGANQARIEQRRFRRAFDPVVKIGRDLEELGEFLVMGAEQ